MLIFKIIAPFKGSLVILFLLTAGSVYGQLNSSGNLKSYIDSIISNMPATFDNDDYQAPSTTQLEIWERIITDINSAQYLSAHNRADSLGYEVVHYTDTEPNPDKDYYILQKQNASLNYWGTFIFNQSPDRMRIIIQSPHPKFDFNTGRQGFIIFRNIGARVFCLSGTHRCNSSSFSNCDGTTTVCTGSSESYRASDQAHNINSTFQRTTTTLSVLINNIIIVQPHGFTKDPGDPDLIMSNGSRSSPTIDYLSTLKAELLLIDNDLTFKIAHIDTTWDKLNALVNTQGRFINGSIDPCDDNAPANTGRFLHVEQAKDSLRDTETNLLKLSNALANVFPVEQLPVELISFSASRLNNSVLLKWHTALEVNNYGFEVERQVGNSQYTVGNKAIGTWENIGFVKGNGSSNSVRQYYFTDQKVNDVAYLYYKLKQIDNDGKFEYSGVVEVSLHSDNGQGINPDDFGLEQNYPNPFNPATNFWFRIPGAAGGELVALKIYDVLGNEIATLLNEGKQAGEYEIEFDAAKYSLPSGVYYCTLIAGAYIATIKLVLLK